MIDSITITHLNNDGVGLSSVRIANPFERGNAEYILRDSDGLGPVRADFTTRKKAALTGVHVNNISRGGRTIRLAVSAGPGYTDDTTWRRKFYSTVNSGNFLGIAIRTVTYGTAAVYSINGYVVDVSRPATAEFPDIYVTIFCSNPAFTTDPITLTISGRDRFIVTNDILESKCDSGGFVVDLSLGGSSVLRTKPWVLGYNKQDGDSSFSGYRGVRIYSPTGLSNYIRIDTRRNNRQILSATSTNFVQDNKLLAPGGEIDSGFVRLFSNHSWLTLSELRDYTRDTNTLPSIILYNPNTVVPVGYGITKATFYPEYMTIDGV